MRVAKVHAGCVYVPDMETRMDPRYPHAVRSVPVLHDTIVNYGKDGTYRGSGGYPEDTRECITTNAAKNHDCPQCGVELDCINDYIGGGSHYWHLRCQKCSGEFYFDTYRFVLEAA